MDYPADIVQILETEQDLPRDALYNARSYTSVGLRPQLPYVVNAVAQRLGDDAAMEPMGAGELESIEIGEVVAEASVGGVSACDLLEHVLLVGALVGPGRESFGPLARQDFQRDESVFPIARRDTSGL